MSVTAVIPSIPRRSEMLARALRSVDKQTVPVQEVSIYIDHERVGSAESRNRALEKADTEWVAFLDDDDEWMPHHIETLMDAATLYGADVYYPWFEVISTGDNAFDPFPEVFERPFKPEEMNKRNYIPITVLARTEKIKSIGGFRPFGDQKESACDDWGTWRKLIKAGCQFHHVPIKTWYWHWHGTHTSGLGTR